MKLIVEVNKKHMAAEVVDKQAFAADRSLWSRLCWGLGDGETLASPIAPTSNGSRRLR